MNKIKVIKVKIIDLVYLFFLKVKNKLLKRIFFLLIVFWIVYIVLVING